MINTQLIRNQEIYYAIEIKRRQDLKALHQITWYNKLHRKWRFSKDHGPIYAILASVNE